MAGAAMADDKVAELRTATRVANETLRDLRTTLKEARELLHGELGARLDAEAARQVGLLGNATEQAMAAAVARVCQQFDKLANILLGLRDGGISLEELVTMIARKQVRNAK
jgi:hypothetical protein